MRLVKCSIFLTLALGCVRWAWHGSFDQAVVGLLFGPPLALAAVSEWLAWRKLG
jgi:hypothetical protein